MYSLKSRVFHPCLDLSLLEQGPGPRQPRWAPGKRSKHTQAHRPASCVHTGHQIQASSPQASGCPGHTDHSGFWGLLTSAPWELPFLLPRSDPLCYADRGTRSLWAHLLRCWSCPEGAPHPVPPRPPPSSMRPAPLSAEAPTGRLTRSLSFLPVHSTRNAATRAQKAEF